MKEFQFDKFMQDIAKREEPRNDIKELPKRHRRNSYGDIGKTIAIAYVG